MLIICFDLMKNIFLAATQFHEFFALPEMMPVTERFTIYHINAPGQDDQANPLPTAYRFAWIYYFKIH